ncbi:MAG: hypothetical protein ABI896_10310 [Actinomycetota bacterium]
MRSNVLHSALGFGSLLVGLVLAPLLAAKAPCDSAEQALAVLGLPGLTGLAVGVNVYVGAPAGGRTRRGAAAALGLLAFVVPALFAGLAVLATCAG